MKRVTLYTLSDSSDEDGAPMSSSSRMASVPRNPSLGIAGAKGKGKGKGASMAPARSPSMPGTGNGKGKGQVKERFEREVTRTLQGTEVTKDGDEDNPAYLIKQDDGDEVLKRGSERSAQN